jgi:glycosyltransferase involved in cell wall biosynthesis
MAKVSVIVPSHYCKYANQTVQDLFKKAKGDLEVLCVLDGYWADPPIEPHKNLTILHRAQKGMRNAINCAANLATGKYIMKCDDHCMFAEGFDLALQADCPEGIVAVPSRYSFDIEKWERGYIGPVEYLYMTFPYYHDNMYGMGLHGKKWIGDPTTMRPASFYYYERKYADKKIDGIIATQGSCWFMNRSDFFKWGMLDEVHSYLIHQEPQEITFKAWLSGGQLVVNKNTWYAHWHKNEIKRGIRMSRKAQYATEQYGTWYWMNDKWPQAIHKMEWLIEKFLPMPGWSENWKEEKVQFELDHPEFGANYIPRVFDARGIDGLPIHDIQEAVFSEEEELLKAANCDPEVYKVRRTY